MSAAAPVASAAVSAPTTQLPVSAPASAPVEAEGDLVSDLLENPLVPAAAGGLVAILVGLGLYRVRQRKKSKDVDSSFMESRLQPDSFFGSSGGQKVDTTEGDPGHSSMAYSPSQLDAAGDVDPVAEADVYLAYGRDLQAEEILKEAIRINPNRAAIYFKLLQIYAKRRDARAYSAVAADAFKLSQGKGVDWAQAAEVGHELDPTNPLFQPGADPQAMPTSVTQPLDLSAANNETAPSNFAVTDVFQVDAPAPGSADATDLDLDLDLDFSSGSADASAAASQEPTVSLHVNPDTTKHSGFGTDIDLDAGERTLKLEVPEPNLTFPSVDKVALANASTMHAGLEFSSDFGPSVPPPLPSVPAPISPTPADSNALEFDLNSLSLDLDPPAPAPAPVSPKASEAGADDPFRDSGAVALDADVSPDDALATKLALAEEFQAIGDDDGARTLAQEVADAASGNLKAKAQRFLAELG